MMIIQAI